MKTVRRKRVKETEGEEEEREGKKWEIDSVRNLKFSSVPKYALGFLSTDFMNSLNNIK